MLSYKLKNHIFELGFLQKTITRYQINYLLPIVMELHISLIQYISFSNTQLQIFNNSFNLEFIHYPRIEIVPYLLLQFLFMLMIDIDNNRFENIKNIIPLQIEKIRYIIENPNIILHKTSNNIIIIPKKNIIFINKSELDTEMDENCSICLEKHYKRNTNECDCSHHFGKDCLKNWMIQCKKSKRKITCPICRIQINSVTYYKEESTWRDVN